MKFKRVFYAVTLIVALMLVAVTSGCSPEGDANGEGQGSPVTLKFGHGYAPDSSYNIASEMLRDLVKERTDGRVLIEIHPAGQMGEARELVEAVQMGTLDMAEVPTARVGNFDPSLQILDFPFLFPDHASLLSALMGDFGQELLDHSSEAIGCKALGFYPEGFKNFLANKPIRTPDDMKGLKIRILESPICVSLFESLGANTNTIAWAELYNALQQNAVDGCDLTLESTAVPKFYEVVQYLTRSHHGAFAQILLLSNDAWAKLSEEDRDILLEAVDETAIWCFEELGRLDEQHLKTIKDNGMEVIELTPEEREAFRLATLSVHDEYADIVGRDLVDSVYKALGIEK